MYAAESGGKQLVEDGEATFDSDEGKAVADLWATMYSEGLSPQEKYSADSFADGKAAMATVGPWAIAVYGDAVNWGAVPVPTSTGTAPEDTYTFSDAKNIGLYSACDNQKTAFEVLKFATSEEQDGKLLELTGQMPLRTDLAATYPDYFKEHPEYAQFADQASRTVEVPNVPELDRDLAELPRRVVLGSDLRQDPGRRRAEHGGRQGNRARRPVVRPACRR